MHFDQRTQAALREVGLDTEAIERASELVVEETARIGEELEAFFEEHDEVYSDLELAHSTESYPKHTVDHLDLTTHAAEMRGWLRFDSWGAFVEDGRVLSDGHAELTLGPSVHDRVRFAADRETLR